MKSKKTSKRTINKVAINKYNLASFILISRYTNDYEIMKDYVIKGLNDNSINVLEKRLLEILSELDISLTAPSLIHQPKSIGKVYKHMSKHGHISKQYDTLELQFAGGVFYIRYASIERMKNSSTSSKEILFMHCISSLHSYKTFPLSSTYNNLMEYKFILCQIINDIKENGIKHAYDSDVQLLIEELEYELTHFSGSTSKSIRKTILNTISGGNYIKYKKINNEYTAYRNDFYNIIRNNIKELTGSNRIDNVFPADIVFIKKGFEHKIIEMLSATYKTKEEQSLEFYNYFMNIQDYDNGLRLPIIGISLKQEIACAGKGKSAVGKDGNLTVVEQNLSINKMLDLIYLNRLFLKNLNIPDVSYKIYGKMNEFENTLYTVDKLSATKLVSYIFKDKNTYSDVVEYIETIITTCAGLGKNPAYSKIIMNERGSYEKVKCVNYERNYKLRISKSSKIEIIDKNSSNVIDIMFLIDSIDQFSGKQISVPVKLEIRTNNSKSKQSTVELKYL